METRLKIIEEVEPKLYGKKKIRMVKCLCECGNEVIVRLNNYNRNHTKSCGCLAKEVAKNNCIKRTKHGQSKRNNHSPTYISWRAMVERITNQKHKSFHHYGGRGITVCDRWLNSFENFLEDMGTRPQGFSIDRIDPNGNYEPQNCRWADVTTQVLNRRVMNGNK